MVGVCQKAFRVGELINVRVEVPEKSRTIPMIMCSDIIEDRLHIDTACLFLQLKVPQRERGGSNGVKRPIKDLL